MADNRLQQLIEDTNAYTEVRPGIVEWSTELTEEVIVEHKQLAADLLALLETEPIAWDAQAGVHFCAICQATTTDEEVDDETREGLNHEPDCLWFTAQRRWLE